MPEVRHGSNLGIQSDPVLTDVSQDVSHNHDAAPTPPSLGATAARPRPLQQSQTQSADNVPVTHQVLPGRLSFMLGRRPSSSTNNAANPPPAQRTGSSGSTGGKGRRRSSMFSPTDLPDAPRRSLAYAQRPTAEAYYDSRAATRREWKRRHKTLEEYYEDNPDLLPQLPFTWHHGNRRWRLWFFAFLVFVDASVVPVALYYGMKYAGDVEEWIIFAVVTTIWGGPTYLEFAIRTLRLIKEERFYRPLGTTSRWCADMLTWASTLTITVVTALFIIGSAPHDTWLRVVAMAAPSILWCLGGVLLTIQLLHMYKIPAPFRISSTGKGEPVLPGVYYFIEDVLAVNARCGRPYREALHARYTASPRFREMLNQQSLFWSIPSLIMAAILTVIAVIPQVPENWSYGVCWLAPFGFAFVWGVITIVWCKRCMVRERLEWEAGRVPQKELSPSSEIASPV